jgi:hypothetical protein
MSLSITLDFFSQKTNGRFLFLFPDKQIVYCDSFLKMMLKLLLFPGALL